MRVVASRTRAAIGTAVHDGDDIGEIAICQKGYIRFCDERMFGMKESYWSRKASIAWIFRKDGKLGGAISPEFILHVHNIKINPAGIGLVELLEPAASV